MSEERRRAVFEGLVFDEAGRPLEVVFLGGEPHYVIDDDGFRRHVEAAHIDGQVLKSMQAQIDENKDAVEEGMMRMMGQSDPFTKAAIGAQLGRIEQIMQNGLPAEARQMLGWMGFRIVVDVHGEVINIEGGGVAESGDE